MPWYWIWFALWLPLSLAALVAGWAARDRLRVLLREGRSPTLLLAGWGIAVLMLSLLATPTGDEPHYLIMSQSLLNDGDFDLRNNYEQAQYLAYYPEPIPDPHVTIVGEHWYPVHDFGLPVLAAPWFALGGRAGVVVLLVLMSLAGLRLLWSTIRLAGFSGKTATVGTLVAALTLPFVVMAGQIFPEVPAFLLVTMSLWALFGARQPLRLVTLAVALAALPWLHPKYLALGLALIVADLVLNIGGGARRRAVVLVPVFAASAVALALVSYAYYGVPLPGAGILMPSAPFGNDWLRPIAGIFLAHPWEGMAGLLFDQQSGLLFVSPIFIVAIGGWVFLWRRSRRPATALGVVFLSVYLPAAAFSNWFGGFSSPARFLVPTVPVLVLLLAEVLERAGDRGRRMLAILAVPSIALAYLMATLPSFVRYGDPATLHNYFVATLERLANVDLTLLFPSLRTPSAATWLTLLGYVAFTVVINAYVLRFESQAVSHRPGIRAG
jgi:hypothetical protein